MSDAHVLYAVADRVATITLNRPRMLNALGGSMREDILARLYEAEQDAGVGCVVITGAGDAFCAGGDIANMIQLQIENDAEPIRHRMQVAGRLIVRIRRMSKPVIAAVNGVAAGAGLNLALACDVRYAADRARFAASFVRIGLVPDWAGHYLLTRLVGTGRAMELMMLGDRFDAAEALRLGLVNQIFLHTGFRDAIQAIAARYAAGPAAALAAIKRGVYLGASGSLDDTLAHEEAVQCALFLSDDAREGMRAFIEKRPPRFGSG